MSRVCKETLRQRIDSLTFWLDRQGLSLNEEFQLEAYRMLLEHLEKEGEE